MKFSFKKTAFYLLLGFQTVSCFHAKNVQIDPKILEVITEKSTKDSFIFPLKLDSISTKIDSIKLIISPFIVPKTISDQPQSEPIISEPPVIVKQDSIKKTGEQIFEFYEISSPDILFYFPSHSVVMIQGDVNKLGVANSFCEYWLFTKTGKLVCYCKNTVSGLHPVYANSFNANNHKPEYTKKIAFGEYRLVYKNISKVPVKQELQAGLIINENKDQVDLEVNSGETKEFWINVYPTSSHFKLNNNNRVGN